MQCLLLLLFLALFSLTANAQNVTTEEGIIYIIKAGPKLEVLANNDLGEPCFATPAISQGALYFRTSASLIAIR